MFQLTFWCIIVLIIFTGQQTAALLDPGYEYVEEADAWLRLHIMPAEWHDARLRCKLEGGVLASPSITALTKAMISVMTKYNYVLSRGVFTGIHDLISEGDLMSLDGTPVSDIQLNWVYGYPSSNNEKENCVKLTGNGEVTNESCAKKYAYFCHKDNATMVINQDCHTTAIGYEYESCTGSCYKFHRVSQTWHNAARVCHAEGGYLAIINSKREAQVLQEIFEKNPGNTIIGAEFDHVALIGLWKWNDKNDEWLTVHDQTLDEAGYSVWGDNQPNNAGGMQNCGSIFRDGGLNDIGPHVKLAFFCEITPK